MVRVRWIGALVVAVGLIAVGTPAHSAAQPDSITQPPQDGCERNPGGLLAGTSPQWVYVNRDPSPQYAVGTARNARPTETDLARVHDSYDMNIFFAPDAAYQGLLGTANTSTAETQDKDEQGTMEIEWEQRAQPLFSWPTENDRVDIMGSWIWDCGHWGPQDITPGSAYLQPGTQPGEVITGERTEFHPPRMVVVHRTVPTVSSRGDAVADALISSKGTHARAVEDWAANRCGTPRPPTADPCSQWTPVNDRNYDFDVPAPPRPKGAGNIQWSVVDRGSVNAPAPVIKRTTTGIHVTVPFKGWGVNGTDMVFAKTFQVGWNIAQPVHHYRVTLDKLTWLSELDGPQTGQCNPELPCTGNPQSSSPPDELNFYVEVAGQWRQLQAPPAVNGQYNLISGTEVPLADTFDLWLSGTPSWRVLGRGRECDQPNMKECSAPEEGFNDDAGIGEDLYQGGAGVGAHTMSATSDACTRSTAGPCFTLAYRIDDLGPS